MKLYQRDPQTFHLLYLQKCWNIFVRVWAGGVTPRSVVCFCDFHEMMFILMTTIQNSKKKDGSVFKASLCNSCRETLNIKYILKGSLDH